uniref:F-box domain-containing protein n=1 Tax=Leersia perrieri TaxID=77586 RepID=A0A0D9VBV7_9ORYZ
MDEILNDDVVGEILAWLPAKAVLRCRAVCRLWRSLTTTPYFIAAHSRRRPLELLGYVEPADRSSSPFTAYIMSCVPTTAVPAVYDCDDELTAAEHYFRRLLRRDYRLLVSASGDGLLLLCSHRSLLVCNPATRQLVKLPLAAVNRTEYYYPSAFYFHRPSGHYRVLMCCRRLGLYYVVSTGGGGEPRRRRDIPEPYSGRLIHSVTIGERVYWARSYYNRAQMMLAFDTAAETFWPVAPPPVEPSDEGPMFEMDGELAVTAMSVEPYLDVWTTQDLTGERWVRRFRIELPCGYYHKRIKPYGTGLAIFDNTTRFLVVAMNYRWAFLYDTKHKRMVSCSHRQRNDRWCVFYRESLVTLTPSTPFNDKPWLKLY